MTMEEAVRQAEVQCGALPTLPGNAPAGTGADGSVFVNDTKLFYARQLKWSSNTFAAKCQGLGADFETFHDVRLRAAPVINARTGEHLEDSWQRIIVDNLDVDTITPGAKVIFGGSTWLVTNPANVASITGTAIVRKCNVVWHFADWYGNVLSEPMVFAAQRENATANEKQDYTVLIHGYQRMICQRNDHTEKIAQNLRMLFGRSAFSVRGIVDFVEEFTGKEESARLMHFDIQREETVEGDDFTRHIRAGDMPAWELRLGGAETMTVGQRQTLGVALYRDGTQVEGTAEHPLTLLFSAEGDAVSVALDGSITAEHTGKAAVTCSILENPEIRASFTVTVADAASGVFWRKRPPERLRQFETISVEAADAAGSAITYRCAGAEGCWSAAQSGNVLTVECYRPSRELLMITPAAGDAVGETAAVKLESY